jgi:RNA polymerase-binding transcription factor DksA
MPKTQKPSVTIGEPANKGPQAEKAAGSAKPPSKKPAAPARHAPAVETTEESTPAAAQKSTPTKSAAAKKPAGGVNVSGSAGSSAAAHKAPADHAKADPSAKAATETAKKPAEHATGKSDAGRGTAAKAAPAKAAATPVPADDDQPLAEFLAEMRVLLREERAGYVRQADELKAEADSLALEHEPGDVQFDEEGGEGGTSNVDRELDLVLSAQARSAIMEIDRATLKIEAGSYGTCEQCGQPIPQARLKALPYASLCVACKSGGLSRR